VGSGPSRTSSESTVKDSLLAEIRKSKSVFYNTVVAQAQTIELAGDRVTFTFSPTQRALRDEFERTSARFAGEPVPRPPVWGGYRVLPARIEFWHSGEHRLHDRTLYTREGDAWKLERLFP